MTDDDFEHSKFNGKPVDVFSIFIKHLDTFVATLAFLTFVIITIMFVPTYYRRRINRKATEKASLVDNEVAVNVDIERPTIHV